MNAFLLGEFRQYFFLSGDIRHALGQNITMGTLKNEIAKTSVPDMMQHRTRGRVSSAEDCCAACSPEHFDGMGLRMKMTREIAMAASCVPELSELRSKENSIATLLGVLHLGCRTPTRLPGRAQICLFRSPLPEVLQLGR